MRGVGRFEYFDLFIHISELSILGWEKRYRGIMFLPRAQGRLRWIRTTDDWEHWDLGIMSRVGTMGSNGYYDDYPQER